MKKCQVFFYRTKVTFFKLIKIIIIIISYIYLSLSWFMSFLRNISFYLAKII